MTIEEIRKNAPDGADFYIDGEPVKYFMAVSGDWFIWQVNGWMSINSLVMQQYRDDLRRLYPCK